MFLTLSYAVPSLCTHHQVMTDYAERQPLLKTVGEGLDSKHPRQLGPRELSPRQRAGILCGLWLATFLSVSPFHLKVSTVQSG